MKKIFGLSLIVLLCISTFFTVSAEEATWLVEPQYDDIYGSDESGASILVSSDEKFGYIDKNGKVLIDFIYDYATLFSNEIAYVEKNDVYSYIDMKGKVLFDLKAEKYLKYLKNTDGIDKNEYLFGSQFYGDYAIVSTINDESFLIDRNGKYVPVPEGVLIRDYEIKNNIAIIGKEDSTDLGYLNIKTGDYLYSYTVSIFENGYGIVDFGDGYISVVDNNLKYVTEDIYVGDAFASLTNGIIKLIEYNVYYEPISFGYIDINGKTIIPKKYIQLGDYDDNLIAAVVEEDGITKVGYLDINGNWVIKPSDCTSYSGFIKGIAAFSKNYDELTGTHNFGLINKSGDYVLQPQLHDFSYDINYAYAEVDGLWGVLDISNLTENESDQIKFDPNDMPDTWAIEEVTKSINNKLVPLELQNKYKEKITRKEFCDLAISLLESVEGKTINEIFAEKGVSIALNPFTDSTDKHVIYAYSLSIVNGKGNGLFDPNGNITRQEAAVMLTNTAKALGFDITSIEASFKDSKNIASWAKNAVNFVSSNNIMKGTNIGFEPTANYTRQQAYLTILRLFETLK